LSETRRVLETGTEDLLCHVEDRVAVITLNRPDARNALTLPMKDGMRALLPELLEDEEVGCVLLTGAGGAFCAGGDTKVMADGPPPLREPRLRMLKREHEVPTMLHRMEKPTIAALPGAAAGAGLGLALACDLRIFAERAFITTAYVRLGLSGDYGVAWFLTQLVGTGRAKELFFTSARLDAESCERLGVANRVVPDADLAKEAFAFAAQIAAGPPIALRSMKNNLNRAITDSLETCLDIESERMVAGAFTEDYVEAVKAFTEKRKGVFKGR
jgi:enoyl-CoA hydratase/carnithine racemase